MVDARTETSWVPPGLPAPGPGEPAVETLISVARGIARGAPWSVIAESRDLDFEEVRLWPWKFPNLWDAYYQKALKLQREELAARSLNNLEMIQNSGTLDEIRRAAEGLLRYNTMMGLLEKQSSEQLSGASCQLPVTRERAGSGVDDERTFLPRLPVLMPRGRSPKSASSAKSAVAVPGSLPTPEAIAVLRQQLKDPDPDIAHRAARTTLMHDARMYSLEMRYGEVPLAALSDSPDSEPDAPDAFPGTGTDPCGLPVPVPARPVSADVRQGPGGHGPEVARRVKRSVSPERAGATRGEVSPDTGSAKSADGFGPDPPDTS